MSSEHIFDDKNRAKPQPKQEEMKPEKQRAPVTRAQAESSLNPGTVQQMQQTMGNTAVQRILAQRQSTGPSAVEDDAAAAINSKRGQGHALDSQIAQRAGQTMGQDLSGVNVHTDSDADQLSQQLGAKAFTTGNDIFFREGAYDPAGSDGQRLIAHELTHVVQQGASAPSVQGKMTVNDPNDQFEAEADQVADKVMNPSAETAVARQEEEEELQMQPIEEEGEEIMMQEEEEELMMQPIEEEEEMLQP